MSGLGTTMSPTGESGSVSQMDQVIEAIPNNPATLAADTSIENLSHILTRDWIWKETVTVSTAMAPGTVFAILPIHPYECNRFVKHVASMFNCWTGNMFIRMRMMATAFYGGSIRVGYLPPNLTTDQIRQMPLDVLTVFPNDDFDPKNTNWTHFSTPDERDVAYHYMSRNIQGWDENDKRSFGGYIVLYVAGRLVTQNPEMTSINIILETSGNFNFSQVNPLFGTSIVPDTQGTLYGDALDLFNYTDVDNHQGGYVGIISAPSVGFQTKCGAFRGEALGYADFLTADGINMTESMRAFRNNSVIDPIYAITGNLLPPAGGYNAVAPPNLISAFVYSTGPNNVGFESEFDIDGVVAPSSNGTITYPIKDAGHGPPADFYLSHRIPEGLGYVDTVVANSGLNGNLFRPNAANEVLIWFVSPTFISLQSRIVSQQLKIVNRDPTISEIYHLIDENNNTILTMRLNPNGLFSVATTARLEIEIKPGYRLQYVQDLPITSPMMTSRKIKSNLRKLQLNNYIKEHRDQLGLSDSLMKIMLG